MEAGEYWQRKSISFSISPPAEGTQRGIKNGDCGNAAEPEFWERGERGLRTLPKPPKLPWQMDTGPAAQRQ